MKATQSISKTTLTAVSAALILSGCSFKEERDDVIVPIVDASPAKVQSQHKPVKKQKKEVPSTHTYTVQSGDTLGLIAQKFLGASSRYTELVELNQLNVNDAIYVGQKLKLPQEELRQLPNEKKELAQQDASQTDDSSASADHEQYPDLARLIKNEQYNQAIQWILNQEDWAGNAALQQKLVDSAQQQVTIYKRQQKVDEAKTLLTGLIAEDSLNASYKNTLQKELTVLTAEQELVNAKRYADNQEFDKAYIILLRAWQQIGQPLEDNILFTGSRNTVSEHYHQKALRHYRNQELEEALGYWKKILAFNPNDDLALVYRDRVKALQNKLDNL
ncbi:LysM peptidoglycan-binding domain-containing protein [Kangiella shandongensis]|uniref:LysM peptidoglycan-binding domain-containing protein n=1 Tax=Kangiella shandongensis TaxID=2763258 RepID=UPI001CBDA0D6|nr:LysM peptidoglycan-binding domain-containing protein [Kangiella shandongensis]